MYNSDSSQLTLDPDINRVTPAVWVGVRCYLGRVCAFVAIAASSFPELNSVTSWPSVTRLLALYDTTVQGN